VEWAVLTTIAMVVLQAGGRYIGHLLMAMLRDLCTHLWLATSTALAVLAGSANTCDCCCQWFHCVVTARWRLADVGTTHMAPASVSL
jgi:hypothetical protein